MDKVNRKDFLGALKKVVVGVDSKDTFLLEGADCFIFDDDWIRSYNNDLSVCVKFPVGIKGAVRAAEFYRLVDKMKGDQLRLSLKKENILVTDGRTSLEMTKMDEGLIKNKIIDFNFEEMKWKKLPDDFLLGSRLCVFSAGDSILGVLGGVYFGENKISSTDRFRASLFQMEKKMDSFVLSKESLSELLKFEGVNKYYLDDNWVHFIDDDNLFFSIRLLSSEYPLETVESLFDLKDLENKKNKSLTFPEGFRDTIERVGLFSYGKEFGLEYIRMEIEGDTITCSGERVGGKVVERIKIKESIDEKITIKISSKSLLDILQVTNVLYFRENKVLFRSSKYFHLISLVINREGDEE